MCQGFSDKKVSLLWQRNWAASFIWLEEIGKENKTNGDHRGVNNQFCFRSPPSHNEHLSTDAIVASIQK